MPGEEPTASAEASAPSPSSYDLTSTLGPFMDRHQMIPLLEFLAAKELYPAEELERAKLELLFKTNMVDLAIEIYQRLHSTTETPVAMAERRDQTLATFAELQGEVAPLLELVTDAGRVHELRNEKLFTQGYLQSHLSISPQHIEVLHRYAKFVYDCGQYRDAANLLANFRLLTTSAEQSFSALWGKLACEIFESNWEQALEELLSLKEAIETRTGVSHVMQLQQRCWLMHWALFLLGNHPNGRNIIIDLYFNERYLNAIQTNAPHLLRYLALAVIASPRRRGMLKELVRVISMERLNYSDPITQFLEALYSKCNFEAAQLRLQECAALIDSDFFLCNAEEDFLKAGRLQIFETYCRIHERIDLKMLAEKLGMEQVAAEKWIVKMVSDAQLNAKIDAQSGHVLLGLQPPDIYQQVIEKTKGLSFRSYVLAQHIEKKAGAAGTSPIAEA